MGIKNLIVSNFDKLKKYKLVALSTVMCGLITLSACGLQSKDYKEKENDNNNSIVQMQDDNEEYSSVKIFIRNRELLEKEDTLSIHDLNDNNKIYNILYVKKDYIEGNVKLGSFKICSFLFDGMEANVDLKSAEEVEIIVDYATKTISYEIKELKNKSK